MRKRVAHPQDVDIDDNLEGIPSKEVAKIKKKLKKQQKKQFKKKHIYFNDEWNDNN